MGLRGNPRKKGIRTQLAIYPAEALSATTVPKKATAQARPNKALKSLKTWKSVFRILNRLLKNIAISLNSTK